jgi:hypothetical protein
MESIPGKPFDFCFDFVELAVSFNQSILPLNLKCSERARNISLLLDFDSTSSNSSQNCFEELHYRMIRAQVLYLERFLPFQSISVHTRTLPCDTGIRPYLCRGEIERYSTLRQALQSNLNKLNITLCMMIKR